MPGARLNCGVAGSLKPDLACATWEADMLGGTVAASQRLVDRLTDEGYVGMLVRSFAIGAGEDDVTGVVAFGGQLPDSCGSR